MMVLLYKFSGKMEIKLEKNIFLSNIRLASFPLVPAPIVPVVPSIC